MTSSRGPDDEVFFVLTHLDGTTTSVPLAEGEVLLGRDPRGAAW